MRWIKKKPPSVGDMRVIISYCIIPKTIDLETRWLEKAYILQRFSTYSEHIALLQNKWIDQKFVDRDYFLKEKIKNTLT